MKEQVVTADLAFELGLSQEEYERIKEILGREPNFTELGIFSVMWSEHCSYKNSKPVLRGFPREGDCILIGAGEENAGVVDIGDGWAVVFKIESHNHPSAIEPFQGAATGVGGILRDIFTMGARPVAILDSLRFGEIDSPKVRYLLGGVVAGIAHYGNCVGVPTVGGEVCFDDVYRTNCLVNALCAGVVRTDSIVRGKATGSGNPVFYVGAATGRDGLGGASFASQELDDRSDEKRPAVQVGDPFMEKLLLEACLELLQSGSIVGIQDMGAAGLTCSTCETASRGGAGIEIDVSRVPQREKGMIPYEIMLSESQERMLVIGRREREEEVQRFFHKWDLHAVEIGRVTDDGIMRVRDGDTVVAEIPARALSDEAPVYTREYKKPAYLESLQRLSLADIPVPTDYNAILLDLLSSPNIACKEWVYSQYDHMVGDNTVLFPGSDAAVVRVREAGKFLALSTDGNGRYCYLDPFEGGKIAVAEAARNVVCSGAKPLAITNCLNFANPMKPEIFWQFKESVAGMSEACKAIGSPVTGGNVSFYNENQQGPVYPTPVVGMLGIIEEEAHITSQWFASEGDSVILLGTLNDTYDGLGGSEYLKRIHGMVRGIPARVDLEREVTLYRTCRGAIKKGIVKSAHDCAEGGLAVAVAEKCISGPSIIGVKLQLPEIPRSRWDSVLFGEIQSRILVSCSPHDTESVIALCREHGFPCEVLGEVGGKRIEISCGTKKVIDVDLAGAEKTWKTAIPKWMGQERDTIELLGEG